jgi:outer membrane lipase/esterase
MSFRLPAAFAAIAVTLAAASPAAAERDTLRYTSLTVFGDSLVDAGNVNLLTGGAAASSAQGYFMGRFTNGYDYTDLLSFALFGSPTVASLRSGGRNYAYGGAQAGTRSAVPDLVEQLAEYNVDRLAGLAVDPNGLYVLNFGGNDVFQAPDDPAAAEAWLRSSAATYAGGIQYLNDIGVRNILFTGYPVATDPLSFDAEGYLTEELAGLTLDADTTLFRFSYLDFFGRVASDPGSLGLPPQRTDITCRQAGAEAIDGGCVGIFSFDGIHPTAPIHQALFRDLDRQFGLTAFQAVPEPGTWAMMIGGIGLAGGAVRRRRSVHAIA